MTEEKAKRKNSPRPSLRGVVPPPAGLPTKNPASSREAQRKKPEEREANQAGFEQSRREAPEGDHVENIKANDRQQQKKQPPPTPALPQQRNKGDGDRPRQVSKKLTAIRDVKLPGRPKNLKKEELDAKHLREVQDLWKKQARERDQLQKGLDGEKQDSRNEQEVDLALRDK